VGGASGLPRSRHRGHGDRPGHRSSQVGAQAPVPARFPSVVNAPSNAICRKLGFTLLGEHEFEYPKGNFMQCNDWRLDLFD
jgi:hypothetical protein